MNRTALYLKHIKLKGKMVDFAGWELPVYYTSIFDEHQAVRMNAGLFDVSHLGRIEIKGPDSLSLIQEISTNDSSRLKDGKIQYSLVCQDDGGIVDDILIYKFHDYYLLVVNASNTDAVMNILTRNKGTRNVEINNITKDTVMIAVQGPKALGIVETLYNTKFDSISKYAFTTIGKAILSRTGYTGEDGFEITVDNSEAEKVWNQLLEIGKQYQLTPCGLGARDTLRLEAGNCLYGHEMDTKTNPYEAGLGFVVKLDKPDFIGKSALTKIKQTPLKRKLVGLEMCDNSIPRSEYLIQIAGQEIGKITSGTFSPSLKKGIALGYVPVEFSKIDTLVEVNIRNTPHDAKVVEKKWR